MHNKGLNHKSCDSYIQSNSHLVLMLLPNVVFIIIGSTKFSYKDLKEKIFLLNHCM